VSLAQLYGGQSLVTIAREHAELAAKLTLKSAEPRQEQIE